MAENLSLSRMIEHEKTEHSPFLNVWQAHHMFVNYEAFMKAHQFCFFFCCWSYGSHQLSGHSWLRSNSLLGPQHADRKFLSLRCEPNETSWHTRVVVWGEYVARCGSTHLFPAVSAAVLMDSDCWVHTYLHPQNRIWMPVSYKILHIPCFPCDYYRF